MEEPKFNNKIEDLEDQLWDIKQRLEYVESVLEIEPEDDEDDYDPTLHPSMEDDHSGDDDYFDQDDPLKHTHDDGTEHSHEGGDEPHTHDEELPNFKKMSKKALDEWAEKRGIILDRRKTKAHMIEELNKQL